MDDECVKKAFAESLSLPYIETSSKLGTNVEEAFSLLGSSIMQRFYLFLLFVLILILMLISTFISSPLQKGQKE